VHAKQQRDYVGNACFNSPVGILAVCALSPARDDHAGRSFQFPGWNSGRLCLLALTRSLTMPRRFQFPGWNSGRLCLICAHALHLRSNGFNSPVGILAVCAQSACSNRPCPRGFNSPVGILAVCASVGITRSTGQILFQFPGWNSGRLCWRSFWPPTSNIIPFQFPGWNSGRLCHGPTHPGTPARPVSIPRLEFWPFVPHAKLVVHQAGPAFQFPGWNSGRLCRGGMGVPHCELVRGFNSPVGILAVCATPAKKKSWLS